MFNPHVRETPKSNLAWHCITIPLVETILNPYFCWSRMVTRLLILAFPHVFPSLDHLSPLYKFPSLDQNHLFPPIFTGKGEKKEKGWNLPPKKKSKNIFSRPSPRLWWRQPFRHLPQVLRVYSVQLTPGYHGQAEVAFFKARCLRRVEKSWKSLWKMALGHGWYWFMDVYGIGLLDKNWLLIQIYSDVQLFWRFFVGAAIKEFPFFTASEKARWYFGGWRRDLSYQKSPAAWDVSKIPWLSHDSLNWHHPRTEKTQLDRSPTFSFLA